MINVDGLVENPELGRELQIVALVKWTNQSYHDENLRSMFTGGWDERADVSKSNAGRHRQQYYNGLIACFSLEADFLDAPNAISLQKEVQPTDIDIRESSVVIAAGNRLLLRESLHGDNKAEIKNPWFARLHSADVIDDKILTVSSAFDQINIVDSTGNTVRDFDIWRTGRNVNKFGHMLLKSTTDYSGDVRINPSVADLRVDNDEEDRVNLITDPLAYKGLGLPTYLTPTFVNHVAYDKNKDQIMATTLNTGECWMLDPESGDIQVVVQGLNKPHGFRRYHDGYIVADSGRERLLVLNDDFGVEKMYSTASFTDRKPGLEAAYWMQNATQLNEDILITISSPRQRVTLIDTLHRQYRDIPYDSEWGMQTIKPYS